VSGASWTEFLHGPETAAHGVQIYSDVRELGDSVGAYLAAGFEVEEPAVVVATPEHWQEFARQLAVRGWDTDSVERSGLLTRVDADATLASFMHDGHPSPAAFEATVGGLVDRAAERYPHAQLRAFGEMVDLLCQRGEEAAAIELENLWNELARTRRFALLCGYRLDVFDGDVQRGPLPEVCRVHSHVRPALDPARLTRAVDRALDEILGPDEAGKIYVLIRRQIREERVPMGQLVLMWISANMPAVAERVLASARGHYAGRPLPA
jgi:DcmR-like sensory protein